MYGLPSVTKANIRQAIAQHPLAGDWYPGHTSGAGSTTTVVDADLSGWGDNEFQEWYVLAGADAGAPGEYRIVDSFSATTLTLRTANSTAVGNDNDYYLHKYRPDWYTFAANTAIRKLYPVVAREVRGFLLQPNDTTVLRRSFGLPRNMERVNRVYIGGILNLYDGFTRADSATTAGGAWNASSGDTFGISSNRLYSVSDTDGDTLTQDFVVKDPFISCVLNGTLNHATTVRCPDILFRYVDTSNYLVVQLKNAVVDLRKVDGGSESSLATGALTTSDGVDYRVWVHAVGSRIKVWVDGVLYIDHQLLGTDLKFTEYTTAGVRLTKGGSPGTNARWDDFYLFNCNVGETELTDWKADASALTFQHSPSTSHLVVVEGTAPLSTLAADTTGAAHSGTIASDTTATMEIQTTDRAWELLVTQGVAELHRMALNFARGDLERAYHAARAGEADAIVASLKKSHYQPQRVVAKSPY